MGREGDGSNDDVAQLLEDALDLTDCPQAKYHIREALQRLHLGELGDER